MCCINPPLLPACVCIALLSRILVYLNTVQRLRYLRSLATVFGGICLMFINFSTLFSCLFMFVYLFSLGGSFPSFSEWVLREMVLLPTRVFLFICLFGLFSPMDDRVWFNAFFFFFFTIIYWTIFQHFFSHAQGLCHIFFIVAAVIRNITLSLLSLFYFFFSTIFLFFFLLLLVVAVAVATVVMASVLLHLHLFIYLLFFLFLFNYFCHRCYRCYYYQSFFMRQLPSPLRPEPETFSFSC